MFIIINSQFLFFEISFIDLTKNKIFKLAFIHGLKCDDIRKGIIYYYIENTRKIPSNEKKLILLYEWYKFYYNVKNQYDTFKTKCHQKANILQKTRFKYFTTTLKSYNTILSSNWITSTLL